MSASVVRDDANTTSSKTQHIKKHKVVNNITLINADFKEEESFEFYIVDIYISFHSIQNLNFVRDNSISFYVQFRDQT
jgi:hypothetical protein